MKSIRILNYVFVIALGFFAVMFGIERFGNKNAGMPANATVFTEETCSDIIGFQGPIPMAIVLNDGKIAEIRVMDNAETPRYMKNAIESGLLEKFYGLSPKEASKIEVDVVSGATFSSNAIIKSVHRSMAIYNDEVNPSPWTWQLFGIIGCAIILLVLSIIGKQKARN